MKRSPKKARPLWGHRKPRTPGPYDPSKSNPRVCVQIGKGVYSISRKGFEAQCQAKREGAAAKAAGVHFHDNPYRKGPPKPTDWLYSAWEYGFTYGAGPETLGRIVEP